ncbi:NAD-dependent epimerase/dehydratase family protein [Geoalkalibacter sp.]|uniref:NAD-dependent epimerase/dehydratase family protein n=1 Tax=Geoalkalibacter sp. TaxID=3041440 RepID=UPI00272E3808|nr:NAD-dependent epimerase/dehydratase family protein [Geoalkalibacter sp.]
MTGGRAVFIVGCGDLGRRVARLARQDGRPVGALVRDETSAQALRTRGIAALVGDLDRRDSLPPLALGGATVFYFVPPQGGGYSDARVKNFLAALAPGEIPARLVYLSTSGVYGDTGGVPATESMAPRPLTARARRRLDAEDTLRAWGTARNVPVVILRVTNIYGPGRLPLHHLQTGHPLLAEEDSRPTSRIHVEDLARICLAAEKRGRAGAVYNVRDEEPCSATAYFAAVAAAAGLACPPRIPLSEAREVMKPLLLSYFTEERLLCNDRMRRELQVELLYPTLAAGLAASLSSVSAGPDDGPADKNP